MAGKLSQHRANKDYSKTACGDPIIKGQQYWSLTAFRRQARYCFNHKPDAATVRQFGGLSRADRASDACKGLRDVAGAYRSLADEIRQVMDQDTESPEYAEWVAALKVTFDDLLEPDFSDIEDLAEEMTNWRDGMQGTALEYTEKYSEVDDCASTLESIDTSIDEPSWDEDNPTNTADELEQAADDLESAADELDSVDFPGMY